MSLRMNTPGARPTPGNATCITTPPTAVQCQRHDEFHLFARWIHRANDPGHQCLDRERPSTTIEPAPGVDGRAFIAYKVTNPSAGVWHYEYAIYNQNLDRGIQSFSVPLGCGITLSNLGFHAPPNHPGIANDGTQGSAGYSNAPWTSNQTASALTWSSETFAQNQNANAIRWGTLYNFRFDSDRPPRRRTRRSASSRRERHHRCDPGPQCLQCDADTGTERHSRPNADRTPTRRPAHSATPLPMRLRHDHLHKYDGHHHPRYRSGHALSFEYIGRRYRAPSRR